MTSLPISLGADTTVCQGNSITIGNFVGNNTYLWSTGATTPSITVNTPGNYAVTCTAPGGCFGIDTIAVAQAAGVNASFTVDTTFCPQIVFVDNSTGASSWSWTFGDGGTSTLMSPIHTYTASNTYTVTLNSVGTCGADVATQTVQVGCLVGINLPEKLAISIYPNPNAGAFKVKLDGVEGNVDFAIYNELGQVVMHKNLGDQRGTIETSIDLGLPAAGVYVMLLKVGDATVSKRILVH